MATLTLHHGDCLEIMKSIADASIDLIICDLPYGCLTSPKASTGPGWRKEVEKGQAATLYRENTGCTWDIKIDLESFWKEVRRIRKSDHSPTVHFCTTKFGYDLMKSNEKEFRYDLVWDKQRGVSFLSANKMPMRSHEMIYVFSKTGATYERIDINNGCVKSVVEIANKKTKGGHPTQKPDDLYKWLIERYCPVGGTVLDPTFGSGTSVFTAHAMGRTAIGIEKDETFFKKAKARQDAIPAE